MTFLLSTFCAKTFYPLVSRDELLNSLDDINIAYRQHQSVLDETNRWSTFDFDRLTEGQRFVLTDITKNNFLDLCSDISSNSFDNQNYARRNKQWVVY